MKGAYILEYVSHKEENGEVTELHCNYIEKSKSGEENAGMKVKGVVQWVNAKDAVDVTLYKYSSLLLDVVDGDKQFDNRINPNSLVVVEGAKAEPYLATRDVGERFQFMRAAYYKLAEKTDKGLICYYIVGLKDSFNK